MTNVNQTNPANPTASAPSMLMLHNVTLPTSANLMSRSEQEILKAQTDVKFLDLSYEQRGQLLNRICLGCGIRGEMPAMLVQVISKDIKHKFPSLRAAEFEL